MRPRLQRWIFSNSLLAIAVGAASGLASSVFLVTLARATDAQTAHPWLLYLLPFAGLLIAWLYSGIGKSAAGGNNLLIDQIHTTDQVNRVPLRMLPLVLGATILTHLFGGSVGREGTAVQMGGAIAGWLSRVLRLRPAQLRVLLMCGISGGFASVFGTPMTAVIFGMEVLAMGGMRYDALIPCLVAALVGDLVVDRLNIHDSVHLVTSAIPHLSLHTLVLVAVAGVAFGLASLVFAEMTAFIEDGAQRLVSNPLWRTFLGGILIVLFTLALGTRQYNGLSLPLLEATFTAQSVPTFAFLFKLTLTALTLGVGFKGGEVTPLFVIGATLGVTLADPLGLPPDMLASLGFIAVFAAAANTPIACIIMGAELFGTTGIAYFGVAVIVAYTISGHHGIYHAQRILTPKHARGVLRLEGATLRDTRLQRLAIRERVRATWPRRRRR